MSDDIHTTRDECCPLCGGPFTRELLKGDGFTIQQCWRCRVAATVPSTYVSQSHYDSRPAHANGYLTREEDFRGYARTFLNWLVPYVGGGRLLDVGCTVGTLVDEARRRGLDAEGLDLDSNAVATGQGLGRPIHCCAIQDWPKADYDVICMSHTLEHVLEPLAFLKACVARLRPGGRIGVVVPCHSGLHARVFGRRWLGWVPSQHYFHYSPLSLEKVFRAAGLRAERIWQESMDHRIREWRWRPKQLLKTLLSSSVGWLGGRIGMGDQVFAVGCVKAENLRRFPTCA